MKDQLQLDTLTLLGVDFLNVKMQEALSLIDDAVKTGTQKTVFFINADCLNKASKDKEYLQILQQGDYVFPDGSGVKLGCKIMGQQVIDNINGTDLLPRLCELALARDYSLYLLGAKPGVAAKMKHHLETQYQGLKITGEHHGYFVRNSLEEQEIIEKMNQTASDILLVAFGVPFQEKWIYQHRAAINAKVLIAVGGLFDFYSGNIPRAPLWLRQRGLEWTYRLYQEPRRMFKRYIIGNPLFIYRIYQRKFSRRLKKG